MASMVVMFGTRALLTAHERMCMEDRERTRQMFEEVKASIDHVERRQELAVSQLSQGLKEIEASVAKLTQRLAWLIGAATAIVVLAQHFHLLSGIILPSIGN
jgi:hypothetical protein